MSTFPVDQAPFVARMEASLAKPELFSGDVKSQDPRLTAALDALRLIYETAESAPELPLNDMEDGPEMELANAMTRIYWLAKNARDAARKGV